MNYRRAVASMLFALCAAPALWAHPHVFIDSSLEFEMSGRDCVGIVVSWTFDVVFSADIIGQFDKDRDGAFDEAANLVFADDEQPSADNKNAGAKQ